MGQQSPQTRKGVGIAHGVFLEPWVTAGSVRILWRRPWQGRHGQKAELKRIERVPSGSSGSTEEHPEGARFKTTWFPLTLVCQGKDGLSSAGCPPQCIAALPEKRPQILMLKTTLDTVNWNLRDSPLQLNSLAPLLPGQGDPAPQESPSVYTRRFYGE